MRCLARNRTRTTRGHSELTKGGACRVSYPAGCERVYHIYKFNSSIRFGINQKKRAFLLQQVVGGGGSTLWMLLTACHGTIERITGVQWVPLLILLGREISILWWLFHLSRM